MSLEIVPVPVGGGWLSIGHRPGKAALPALRDAGVTHVVTLLGPAEGAEELIGRIEAAGLISLWLPLAGARPVDQPDRLEEIATFHRRLASVLAEGRSVFVHCSAGIHRTGMITYSFLRHLGIGSDEARELLGRMREATLDGVTEARLRWGDQFDPDP